MWRSARPNSAANGNAMWLAASVHSPQEARRHAARRVMDGKNEWVSLLCATLLVIFHFLPLILTEDTLNSTLSRPTILYIAITSRLFLQCICFFLPVLMHDSYVRTRRRSYFDHAGSNESSSTIIIESGLAVNSSRLCIPSSAIARNIIDVEIHHQKNSVFIRYELSTLCLGVCMCMLSVYTHTHSHISHHTHNTHHSYNNSFSSSTRQTRNGYKRKISHAATFNAHHQTQTHMVYSIRTRPHHSLCTGIYRRG